MPHFTEQLRPVIPGETKAGRPRKRVLKPKGDSDYDPLLRGVGTRFKPNVEGQKRTNFGGDRPGSYSHDVQEAALKVLAEKDPATGYSNFEFTFRTLMEKIKNGNIKALEILTKLTLGPDFIKEYEDYENRGRERDVDFLSYRIFKMAHYGQQEVLRNSAKVKIIMAGRQWGKTYCEQLEICDTLSTKFNASVLYIGLTQADAVRLMYQPVLDLMYKLGINAERQNRLEGWIRFANGSSFFMRGNSSIKECDDLRGPNYTLIVIDECQSQEKRLKYLVDDICEPMLAKQQGRLIMSGTAPRIPGTYWQERWDKLPAAHRYNFNIGDNPTVPDYKKVLQEKLIEKGWKETNSTYQREWLGKIIFDTDAMVFRLSEDNYYTDESFKAWLAKQYSKSDVYFTAGIDWGYEDYTSFALIAYSTISPELFLLKEVKVRREDITDFANKVAPILDWFEAEFKDFPNKYFNTWADPAGAGKLINAELNRMLPRLDIRSAVKTDKDLGIEQLQEQVNKGNLKIKKDSEADLEAHKIVFKKNEQTETYLREIDDEYYHPELMMSVLYALRTLLKYPLDHTAIMKERIQGPENETGPMATFLRIKRLKEEGAVKVNEGNKNEVVSLDEFVKNNF